MITVNCKCGREAMLVEHLCPKCDCSLEEQLQSDLAAAEIRAVVAETKLRKVNKDFTAAEKRIVDLTEAYRQSVTDIQVKNDRIVELETEQDIYKKLYEKDGDWDDKSPAQIIIEHTLRGCQLPDLQSGIGRAQKRIIDERMIIPESEKEDVTLHNILDVVLFVIREECNIRAETGVKGDRDAN